MIAFRQPTGTGFALRDPYPWGELAGLARTGASLGYRALFLPEITSRDALAAITGLAGETPDLLLGTGVVPMDVRAPQLLAMAAATAQERSGGRLLLGLGTGQAPPGALGRLRELVLALRGLLAGDDVAVGGERVALSLIPQSPVPLWIAALGPRAVRLAGEVADGVLLNWCTPARVVRARRELAEGAAAAGRDPAEIAVAVYVRACVDANEAAAVAAVRRAAGEYASYPAYARQLTSIGLGEEARRAASAYRAGRLDEVPERLIREVCLVGTSGARERLDAYREAGATLPVVYPVVVPGGDLAASAATTLSALAPGA